MEGLTTSALTSGIIFVSLFIEISEAPTQAATANFLLFSSRYNTLIKDTIRISLYP